MWGHVEFQVDHMLTFLHGIDGQQFEELHGRAQLGTKLDSLGKASSRAHTKGVGSQIAEIAAKLKPLNTDRNHVVHGRWGTFFEMKRGKAHPRDDPAAYWNKRQPFFASRLSRLAANIAEATKELDDAHTALCIGEPRPENGRVFLFGDFLTKEQARMTRKAPTPPPQPQER